MNGTSMRTSREIAPPSVVSAATVSRVEHRAAFFIGIGFVLCSIVLWPKRTILLGPLPMFFGAYGVLLVASEALTALLLWMRARAFDDGRVAVLALAYAFSAPIIMGNVLSLPPGGGGRVSFQTPPWLWLIWHIGWASGIVFYAYGGAIRRAAARYSPLVGLFAAALCVIVATTAGAILPPLLRSDGSWTSTLVVGYAVALILDAAALIRLLRSGVRLNAVEFGLVVAVVAAIGEIAFISSSLIRFSLGTYAGRVLSVVSGIAVLYYLVSDYLGVIRRSADLERHAALADASPEIVYMTDANGACTYVNRRWTEVTGQARSDALGDGWLAAFRAGDVADFHAERTRALTRGEPREYEIRIEGAHGTSRWHRTRATPVRDDDGKVVAWLGMAVDVEDSRRALEDLRVMYERERSVSETLQATFLPPFLPSLAGLRFAAVYRAATDRAEVGGDWYDAFPTRDGRIAFSVGDVMGHGFEAASSMIRVRETIRAAAVSLDSRPAAVLSFANRALCAAAGEALATAIFAVYDPVSGLLSYSSAGHPRPLLRRNGEAAFLDGDGIALGIEASAEYPTHELQLIAHDGLALYTDGLIEGTRDLAEGEARLQAAFAENGAIPQQMVDRLLTHGHNDDVALLVMEVSGISEAPEPTVLGWRYHCDDEQSTRPARDSFVDFLRRRGIEADAVMNAELVLGELLANVVHHAPGPVDITLAWEDLVPMLTVKDRGPGIQEPWRRPGLPEDAMSPSGRGLYLVRTLAGEPRVSGRADGGTEVTVPLLVVRTPS